MTKIDQKKKLDNDMLSHCASLQTSVLMENYDLAEDFAVLLLDRSRQQRLLMAAPVPPKPAIDIIEAPGCFVIGGAE